MSFVERSYKIPLNQGAFFDLKLETCLNIGMKREKFLELQKFLWSYDNAKIVANFIDSLTPEGFEQYVTDFFKQSSYWFSAYRNGWFKDQWIDVKAVRLNSDGSRTYLIVQCKKWESYHITEWEVAKFYWKVVDVAREHDCKLIFVATTWLTPNAKAFCDQKGIDYVDYRQLLEFDSEYPLESWKREIRNRSDSAKFLVEWKPSINPILWKSLKSSVVDKSTYVPPKPYSNNTNIPTNWVKYWEMNVSKKPKKTFLELLRDLFLSL